MLFRSIQPRTRVTQVAKPPAPVKGKPVPAKVATKPAHVEEEVDGAAQPSVTLSRSYTLPLADGEFMKFGLSVTRPTYEEASEELDRLMMLEAEKCSAQMAELRSSSEAAAGEEGEAETEETEEAEAEEAEAAGLVARIVPAADLIAEALKSAEAVASMSPIAARAVKEMVNVAFETPLAQGVLFERRLFDGLFGSEDQKEGMAAFIAKRAADWKGR